MSSRRNGERFVISTKVADLDGLVPEKLGVSPAILDSVIFCHQDESLWPMSEPSVLKKRFDEIFEAQRYTKAIDNLKLIRKKHGEELRKFQLEEKHDKENKAKGEESERKMLLLQQEIADGKKRFGELAEEMDRLQEQAREKHDEANSFLSIVNDLDNKLNQLKFRQENIKDLRRTIDEMHESDEGLATALVQYEERRQRIVEERDQKTSQYQELQTELQSSRQALTAKAAEKGKHQSDKDKYDRQLVHRVDFIHEAASRHEIRGYDGDLDDQKVQAFSERIQKMLADKRRDLEHLRRDSKQELEQASLAISELDHQKFVRNQDRLTARKEMSKIERSIADTQKEVNSLDVDEGSEAVLQSNMKDLDARYEQARRDEQDADLDQQIQQEDRRHGELQVESAKLSRELVECTRLATDRAQLDLRKKELVERKRDLDTMTNTWRDKVTSILGRPWQLDSLEKDFHAVLEHQRAEVGEVRSRKENSLQELKNLEFTLSSKRERRAKLSSEVTRCRDAVTKAGRLAGTQDKEFTITDYLAELETLESSYKRNETDVTLFDELKRYYEVAQEKLDHENKCSLCSRDFKDQAAAKSRLISKIAKKLSADSKNELLQEMAQQAAQLKTLRDARPQYDTFHRLQQELPSLTKEIQDLESQKEVLVRQLEDKDTIFREKSEALQDVESISKTVAKIVQAGKDMETSEREIDRLASQQSLGASARSADEIQELQDTCTEQIRNSSSRLEKLKTDRQRMRDEITDLASKKSDLRAKLSEASHQVQNKKRLELAIQTLKENPSRQRATVQEADKDLEALEPQISKAKSLLDAARQRGEAKEQKFSQDVDAVRNMVGELKRIDADIQDYIDRGGPANLSSNLRAIASLEASIANMDRDVKELTAQVNELNKQVDNGDREKKNIQDNINLRKSLREVDTLQRDIRDLQSRNAKSDYDRLIGEAKYLELERGKLNAERERIHGKVHAKDDGLASLMEEWTLFYKDAKAKYRESQIKVETTKAAIEDIGSYGAALDRAVMNYHQFKMGELNRITGELWQSTYQGTDIDTIKIRSDHETTGNNKRNYNYRVCMVKSDVEMDMRGRCSAGQKVLASIIIRLALAESFGLNCGMIALDEPTTNLDSDNIRSLAESLHAIIKTRQQQANLQLIVITHDEEFLKHMQCSDFCDDFFRVKRDEKQNSIIVRESITRVMEG